MLPTAYARLAVLAIVCVLFLPSLLFGQQAPDSSSLTVPGLLLLAALPGISSVLATIGYDGAKTIVPWYDKLPAKVHQILSPVFSFLFGYFLVAKVGLKPVDSVAGIDYEWFNASFSLLGSAGIFRFFKRKAAADATIALETSRASQPGDFPRQHSGGGFQPTSSR